MLGPKGLLLDVYGGILEVAGECLELIALWQSWNRFGWRVVLLGYLGGLISVNKNAVNRGRNNSLTWSCGKACGGGCAAACGVEVCADTAGGSGTFGASLLRFEEGSMVRNRSWQSGLG
jgi:hypothetical protein